jgi:hypothetical protein
MPQQSLARTAGLFYALNILLGIVALMWSRQGNTGAASLMTVVAALEYALVVVLLGCLFEPGGRGWSWGVAAVGLAACALSALGPLHLFEPVVNPLALFGLYCAGLAVMILRSRLLPGWLGVLLILGGLSWMTYLSNQLALRLQPFNIGVGGFAELAFTLYLLILGVRTADHEVPGASAAA